MILRTIIFLLLNFAALAIGSVFTAQAVNAEWYLSLNKAPWTPPGWFFGFAWTTIMICFSIYMALLWKKAANKRMLVTMYAIQWILNVGWNPVFFYLHQVAPALVIIVLLTIIVGWFCFGYWKTLSWKSTLILPYLIWLVVATSLNAYVLLKN